MFLGRIGVPEEAPTEVCAAHYRYCALFEMNENDEKISKSFRVSQVGEDPSKSNFGVKFDHYNSCSMFSS